MRNFVITGTGTDIGKTFVTAALARQLLTQGEKVRVLKPIVSGWVDGNNDTETLLRAVGQVVTRENIDNCSPWKFAAPLAADMAADLEGRVVKFSEVVEFCRQPFSGVKLIETAGGVMSPLNNENTFLDLVSELQYPVILVAGSYVGAISHTLTALKSLVGLDVRLVINQSSDSAATVEDTARSISQFSDVPISILHHSANKINVTDLIKIIS